jgi:hypothetical protein
MTSDGTVGAPTSLLSLDDDLTHRDDVFSRFDLFDSSEDVVLVWHVFKRLHDLDLISSRLPDAVTNFTKQN